MLQPQFENIFKYVTKDLAILYSENNYALYNSVIFIGLNLVHTVVMIIIKIKKDAMYHNCALSEDGPFGLKYVVNE